jgi:hypothetical protein
MGIGTELQEDDLHCRASSESYCRNRNQSALALLQGSQAQARCRASTDRKELD